MDIQVNQFSYNFDNGKITSAQVGLYGNDAGTSNFVNASVRILPVDLPEGKDFMAVAMQDMVTIARQKLASYTAIKEATTKNAQ